MKPVYIDKIIWKILLVSVDNGERLKLMKLLENKKHLYISFHLFKTYKYPEFGNPENVRSLKLLQNWRSRVTNYRYTKRPKKQFSKRL